jgi:hypothetical protein
MIALIGMLDLSSTLALTGCVYSWPQSFVFLFLCAMEWVPFYYAGQATR